MRADRTSAFKFTHRISSGFALSDGLNLVRVEIAEAPACCIDRDSQRSVVPLKEVCCVIGDVPDLALAQDIPKTARESAMAAIPRESMCPPCDAHCRRSILLCRRETPATFMHDM